MTKPLVQLVTISFYALYYIRFVWYASYKQDKNERKKLAEPEFYSRKAKYLSLKVSFFRYLSDHEQRIFIQRCFAFIQEVKFAGRQGLEITWQHEWLIASTYVKMTWGLGRREVRHFKRIFVFPRRYYNRLTRSYHLGEASPMGVLVFSWEDFLSGLHINDDSRHLGVHEFTHMLCIEAEKYGSIYSPFDRLYKSKFKRWAHRKDFVEKLKRSGLYRDYGFTNSYELLAVSMEVFFENPEEMQRLTPRYYGLISSMLNMDINNMKRNYEARLMNRAV